MEKGKKTNSSQWDIKQKVEAGLKLQRKLNEAKRKHRKLEDTFFSRNMECTWNFSGGGCEAFKCECKKYGFTIVAIREIKQKGNSVTELDDHIFFFNSGGENRLE